jgi:hypothetical protein
MVDVDDDRPLGVERGADVAARLRREARARPAAAGPVRPRRFALDAARVLAIRLRRSLRSCRGWCKSLTQDLTRPER